VRVIAGEFRSRVLKTVPGPDVRPTPDRLREALFNILAPDLPRCVFLDAYAGSGSVGIEALSRGAARAIFIEQSKEALAVLDANLKALGLLERSSVMRAGVRKKMLPDLADLVFLDPPYHLEKEYALVLGALESDTRAEIVVAQHSIRTEIAGEYGHLKKYRELRQGESALSFFRPARPGTE
jgi:16S rRNA (guanine966-N2)-methyltransferase